MRWLRAREVMGGREAWREAKSDRNRGDARTQTRGEGGCAAVELPDEIKKKSFSQSVQAAVQSSDLICFQGPFCFLLSCCASNRATAMGNINPRDATRTRRKLSLHSEPSCGTHCCDAARPLKRLA